MKNYIFDLYGTLVDINTDEQSEKFKESFSQYFRKINPHIDFFKKYFVLCKELAECGTENYEIDLSAVFFKLAGSESISVSKRFRELSTKYLKVYDGVYSFLSQLKKRDAKLYILSNAQSCFTMQELDKLKLTDYFDGIELSSDFGKKKPDKSFFEHILSKYSLKKEECIYTGNDVYADIQGAKAINLLTAYVLSNLSPKRDTLDEALKAADFACDSHKLLFEYLLSL